MLYIRRFYSRPQRAVVFSLLVLLLGIIVLSNFHNRTAGVKATAMSPPMPAPTCAPTPPNMTAWLPGDGNANNLATPSNMGSLQGGATATGVGKVGQGFNLDGVDDYVAVSNNVALNVNSGDFSIDAWIKTSVSGLQTIVDKRVESPPGTFTGYALFLLNGQLGVQLADGTATNFIGGPTIMDNMFHHVAVTVSRSSMTGGKLYVDGVAVLTFDPTSRPGSLNNNFELRIGGHSINYPSFSFNGCIDEVELFKGVLTSTEVSNIFNAQMAGKCKPSCFPPPAGLVSWYPGEGNANDIVGSNNGTLQNGTAFAAGEVGQAFSLDGINDYVDLGSGFNLDKMTLDAWVYVDSSTNIGEKRVISKDNYLLPGTRKLFTLKSSAPFISGQHGRAAFVVLIGAAIDCIEAPSALATGWHLLAGVRDTSASRFELYVDGALVNSKVPTVIGAIDSAVNTVLGRVSPSQAIEHFAGRIDETEIFNQALSLAAIQGIFNAGSNGKCPPPPGPPPTTELAIVKTDNVTTVTPSSLVTYMITVTNNGSSVTGALVNDLFPSTITGVSWTCTPSSGADCLGTFGSGDIVSKPVNLNFGSSVVFTVTGTVSSMAVGTISNTATVTAPAGVTDTNLINNTSTDTDTVGPSPTAVDLTLTPTSCGALMRGKTGSMQLRIGNNGPSTATGVMSTTTLPSTVDLCSTSSTFGVSCVSSVNFLGQTIVKCDFQTIANAGFKTVRINFRPRCTASSPIVTFNTVWSNEFELVPRNNSLGTSSAATGTCVVPSPCTVPAGGICFP